MIRGRRALLACGGGALLAAGVAALAVHGHARESAQMNRRNGPRDFYSFTDSLGLVDHRGVLFDADRLRGHVTLFHCIAPGCGITCPLLTQIIVEALKGLHPDQAADVRIVSMTLDPDNDTPAGLRRYAEIHAADAPNWLFLTGRRESIERAATRIGVVERTGGANRLARNSTDLWLLDREGQALARFDANSIDPVRLRNRIRHGLSLERETQLVAVPAGRIDG